MKTLLLGYRWLTHKKMILSFIPSMFYKITLPVLSISAIINTFSLYLGIKAATLIALLMALVVELVSGIYTSVMVRHEPIESGKLSRFMFKLLILLMLIYITQSFKAEYQGNIQAQLFDWLNGFVVVYSLFEIVISILENYAEIIGKPKDYFTSIIIDKLKDLWKKN
jgi:hypothetical protein